jgi:hypothetical protein
MAERRAIRDIITPPVDQPPLCITYPNLDVNFELRPGLIQLLPKFHGRENENPYKHLMAFHVVCASMKPRGVTEDDIKLHAFPFSLEDYAKDWLFDLAPNSISSWTDMMRLFLEKFFPSSRAIKIKKEITGVRQKPSESLYAYWERFKSLCASFPQHNMSDTTIIEHFYNGLLDMERKMIDAASGGALFTKSPNEARDLIDTMASNSWQFENQEPSRRVIEVRSSDLESQISQLTSLVKSLVVGNSQQAKVCGVCAQTSHPIDMCPMFQEDGSQQANAIGNFPGLPQRKYDPYSNTYNPGWREHPNFSYGPRPQNPQPNQFRPPPPQQNQFRPPQPQQPRANKQGMSLEDIVQSLATNTLQFQQEMKASIQNLENQVSQLATSVGRLESRANLPSQTEVNLKQNASVITLRSGKELPETNLKN